MRAGAALLAVLLVCGSAAAASKPSDGEKLDALRAKLSALSEKQAAEVDRRGSLVRDLRDLERRVGAAAAKVGEAERDLAAEQKALEALQRQRSQRQQRLARERTALAGQVRAAFVTGREERLKLLLNQQDPAVVGRMLAYYDRFNRTRGERIARVDAALAELTRIGREIETKVAALSGVKQARANAFDELKQVRDARRSVLAKVDKELAQRGQDITRLAREADRLRRLLESIGDVFADSPLAGPAKSFVSQRGKLPWPLRGRVLRRYGETRAEGRLKWDGWLIESQQGAEVRSVAAGRVAFADWLPHYCLLVIVEHGDGYLSLYGHNETLYKQLGEWVERGERIAASGDSGGQQNAALYFEVRKGRTPQDPRNWLARR